MGKRKAPLAASRPRAEKENPFEAAHSKKKFAVLGRQSSESKNVNQARSQAVDKVRMR